MNDRAPGFGNKPPERQRPTHKSDLRDTRAEIWLGLRDWFSTTYG